MTSAIGIISLPNWGKKSAECCNALLPVPIAYKQTLDTLVYFHNISIRQHMSTCYLFYFVFLIAKAKTWVDLEGL